MTAPSDHHHVFSEGNTIFFQSSTSSLKKFYCKLPIFSFQANFFSPNADHQHGFPSRSKVMDILYIQTEADHFEINTYDPFVVVTSLILGQSLFPGTFLSFTQNDIWMLNHVHCHYVEGHTWITNGSPMTGIIVRSRI